MIKKIAVQFIVALFIAVGVLACSVSFAEGPAHTTAEVAAADQAVREAQAHAAHCVVYESLSTQRPAALNVFRDRMGERDDYINYHLGVAHGSVMSLAYYTTGVPAATATTMAASILYAREECTIQETI